MQERSKIETADISDLQPAPVLPDETRKGDLQLRRIATFLCTGAGGCIGEAAEQTTMYVNRKLLHLTTNHSLTEDNIIFLSAATAGAVIGAVASKITQVIRG